MYLKALLESESNKVQPLLSKAIIEYELCKYISLLMMKKQKEKEVTKYKLVNIKTCISELSYTELIFESTIDWKNWKVVTNGAYDLLSKMKNSEEE